MLLPDDEEKNEIRRKKKENGRVAMGEAELGDDIERKKLQLFW